MRDKPLHLQIDVILPTDQSKCAALSVTTPLVEKVKEQQKEDRVGIAF